MSLSAIYNKALAEVREASTETNRAIIANRFLNEAWRSGEVANKYRCVVPESTYVRNQLEKIIDRIYETADESFALRRASSVICNIAGINVLSDDDLDAAINMGAAVYLSQIRPVRLINHLNAKLAAPLTYGQANIIIERLIFGYDDFPKKPHYTPAHDVILAFMIKCGREVRRVEKRYARRNIYNAASQKRIVIKHDENILKIMLLSIFIFYVSLIVKFMLY